MADLTNSIFNKRAAERLKSPDDLDKYVRVTNPSNFVVIIACIVLLAALLVWGVLGAVTTSVSTTGVSVQGQAMCFLPADEVPKVNVGDKANVGGQPMTVSEVATVPVSRSEADEILSSDYLVSSLIEGDWAYQVVFDGDTSSLTDAVPISVSITTERIAPITLILGGAQ